MEVIGACCTLYLDLWKIFLLGDVMHMSMYIDEHTHTHTYCIFGVQGTSSLMKVMVQFICNKKMMSS